MYGIFIKLIKYLAWALVFILLQACGSTSKKLVIQYKANAQINPDLNSRPSPLVINTYQLSDLNAFQEADFYSLYENDKTILGPELLHQNQIEIKPGQLLKTEQDYSKQTKYLGFIAAFRDIDRAVWKKIIVINAKEKKPIQVNVSAEAIDVQR